MLLSRSRFALTSVLSWSRCTISVFGQCAAYSSSSSQNSARKVGFIGLGNMGSRMAANLQQGGHQLVVHDRSIAAMEEACKDGAEAASSPVAMASQEGVDVIITMLPSAQHVREVYCGQDGILKAKGGVRPALLIDSSTIDPPTARDLSAAATAAALHHDAQPCSGCSAAHPTLIDAPVSGGITGASKATLTFMCGGEKGGLAAAEPYLKLMGKNIVNCGQSGNGQAAKVCNNLVLGVSMAAVAEGLALGTKLGLDPKLLSDIFNSSSARCWSSDSYNPCPGVMEGVPASKDYKGGFACKLMSKDLGLAAAAAQHCGAKVPMSEEAARLYQQVVDAEGADLDFGSIFKHVYNGTSTMPV
ncbi:hypothetical protein WJX82_001354 [Trebouxia sp. C0006]